MVRGSRALASLRSDKRAVTAVEYGIMAALIAAALVAAMTTFTPALSGAFDRVTTALGSK